MVGAFFMRHHYGLLIAVGIGSGLLIPVLLGGLDSIDLLVRSDPLDWLLLLGLVFVAWNVNAGRIRLLAGGVGIQVDQVRALGIQIATEFSIAATPASSGGPVTYAWLLNRQGMGMSRGMALYAADHMIDLLFFLTATCLLGLYWFIVPGELHLGLQMSLLIGGLLLILGGLLYCIHNHRPIFRATGWLMQQLRASPRTRRKVARWVLAFRRSLQLVRQFSTARLLGVYGLCAGHWLIRYSLLYAAIQLLGGEMTWPHAFLVQMLSLTAGQLVLLPGGSGGAEVSGSLLLAPYLDASTAAAAILLWRFVTFYWYLIAGAPVFALMAGQPLWQRLREKMSDG